MNDTMKVIIESSIGREFANEDVMRADGGMNLLVDISEAISIPKGESARIPTPIRLQGNGTTLALLDVAAGRRSGSQDATGQFLIPPVEGFVTVEVLVVNESGGSLMIQPNYTLGVLSFMRQEMPEEADEEHHEAFVVEATYKPQHFDPALVPEYGSKGAAGMDLRADIEAETMLEPGQRLLIQTGLATAIPAGFEGQIRPRSGLAMKHGISVTNSPATIDSDYRGPIGVILHNLGDKPFPIRPGDRIAQFVFAPVMTATLDIRDALDQSDRGAGGFGSTGQR
jgi:dUTP pyrophosphatase